MNISPEVKSKLDAYAIKMNAERGALKKPLFITSACETAFRSWLSAPKVTTSSDMSTSSFYEVSLLLPKKDEWVTKLDEAFSAMLKEKFPKKALTKLKHPLRCGDEYLQEAIDLGDEDLIKARTRFGGHFYLNAKTKFPLNTDKFKNLLDNKSQPISGDGIGFGAVLRCKLSPYFFDKDTNMGMGLGLQTVQVIDFGSAGGADNSDMDEIEVISKAESDEDLFGDDTF
jgi:hypothetical protein